MWCLPRAPCHFGISVPFQFRPFPAGLNAGIIAELDATSLSEQMATMAQNESIKKVLLAVAGEKN